MVAATAPSWASDIRSPLNMTSARLAVTMPKPPSWIKMRTTTWPKLLSVSATLMVDSPVTHTAEVLGELVYRDGELAGLTGAAPPGGAS